MEQGFAESDVILAYVPATAITDHYVPWNRNAAHCRATGKWSRMGIYMRLKFRIRVILGGARHALARGAVIAHRGTVDGVAASVAGGRAI